MSHFYFYKLELKANRSRTGSTVGLHHRRIPLAHSPLLELQLFGVGSQGNNGVANPNRAMKVTGGWLLIETLEGW